MYAAIEKIFQTITMSVNQEILEQIDQYLEGTLSTQALKSFEKRLKTDASFKELVAEQQLIIRSIKKKRLLEVKKKLSVFHEDMEAIESSELKKETREATIRPLNSRKRISSWIAAAASIVLLLGSYFFFLQDKTVSNTIIAEKEPSGSEEILATPSKYIKIPIQNKAGVVKKEINLLITPSIEKKLKYTLNEDIVVLFMGKEDIPDLDYSLFYDEQRPGVYFIKFGKSYYLLNKTDTPTIAEQATF